MLFELVSLSDQINALNVFRYITFRTGGAIMTALLFVFLFGPAMIDMLRVKQGKGQPIREDGPADAFRQARHAHHGRAHDPVRHHGGTLLWANLSQPLRLDRAVRHAELRRHRLLRRLSQGDQARHGPGFSGWLRLRLEIGVAAVAAIWLIMRIGSPASASTSLTVPFFKTLLHSDSARSSSCSASS